jgi:hypothetical protein
MKEAGADLNITVDQCWEGGTRRIPGKVHQEVSIVGFNFKDLSTNWTRQHLLGLYGKQLRVRSSGPVASFVANWGIDHGWRTVQHAR